MGMEKDQFCQQTDRICNLLSYGQTDTQIRDRLRPEFSDDQIFLWLIAAKIRMTPVRIPEGHPALRPKRTNSGVYQ